jgi:hypothetical protein
LWNYDLLCCSYSKTCHQGPPVFWECFDFSIIWIWCPLITGFTIVAYILTNKTCCVEWFDHTNLCENMCRNLCDIVINCMCILVFHITYNILKALTHFYYSHCDHISIQLNYLALILHLSCTCKKDLDNNCIINFNIREQLSHFRCSLFNLINLFLTTPHCFSTLTNSGVCCKNFFMHTVGKLRLLYRKDLLIN